MIQYLTKFISWKEEKIMKRIISLYKLVTKPHNRVQSQQYCFVFLSYLIILMWHIYDKYRHILGSLIQRGSNFVDSLTAKNSHWKQALMQHRMKDYHSGWLCRSSFSNNFDSEHQSLAGCMFQRILRTLETPLEILTFQGIMAVVN